MLNADLIDIMAGGHIASSTAQFIEQRNLSVLGMVGAAANTFFNHAANLHQIVSESDAMQLMRNITAKVKGAFTGNNISFLQTLEDIQTANHVMQRWIMAMPLIRTKYLEGGLEGYAASYENLHGDGQYDNHYDYRRIYDGVLRVEDDIIYTKHYFEPLKEGDERLTPYQVSDILNTHAAIMRAFDESQEDVTSPTGMLLC